MNKIEGFSKARNMVMIDEIADGSKKVWYWLTPKVQTFIGKLEVGQEVEFDVEEKQGKKTIAFIKAKGNSSPTTSKTYPKEEKQTSKYVCADCGIEMKDNQYETCYKCSMARKEKDNAITPENKDRQSSIRAQAIGNMCSRSLIALQGNFDINNVGEFIDTLFEHYNRNISKLEK